MKKKLEDTLARIQTLFPEKNIGQDIKNVIQAALAENLSYKDKIKVLKWGTTEKILQEPFFNANDIKIIANDGLFFEVPDALHVIQKIEEKEQKIGLIINNLLLKNDQDLPRYLDYIVTLVLDMNLQNIFYIGEGGRGICLLGVKKKYNQNHEKYNKFFVIKLSKLKQQSIHIGGNLIHEFQEHTKFLDALGQRKEKNPTIATRFKIPTLGINNNASLGRIIMEYISGEPLSNILLIREYETYFENLSHTIFSFLDDPIIYSILQKLEYFGFDIENAKMSNNEILKWLDRKDLKSIIKLYKNQDIDKNIDDKKYTPNDREILDLMKYYVKKYRPHINDNIVYQECKKTLEAYNNFLILAKKFGLEHKDRNIGNILVGLEKDTPFIALIDYGLAAE